MKRKVKVFILLLVSFVLAARPATYRAAATISLFPVGSVDRFDFYDGGTYRYVFHSFTNNVFNLLNVIQNPQNFNNFMDTYGALSLYFSGTIKWFPYFGFNSRTAIDLQTRVEVRVLGMEIAFYSDSSRLPFFEQSMYFIAPHVLSQNIIIPGNGAATATFDRISTDIPVTGLFTLYSMQNWEHGALGTRVTLKPIVEISVDPHDATYGEFIGYGSFTPQSVSFEQSGIYLSDSALFVLTKPADVPGYALLDSLSGISAEEMTAIINKQTQDIVNGYDNQASESDVKDEIKGALDDYIAAEAKSQVAFDRLTDINFAQYIDFNPQVGSAITFMLAYLSELLETQPWLLNALRFSVAFLFLGVVLGVRRYL